MGSESRARMDVDLGAVERNVARLAACAPGATLCAVVKADGYGHGAIECAHAALRGGAGAVAVASAAEGRELRDAGIAGRILLLSEPQGDEVDDVIAADLDVVLYSADAIARLGRAGRTMGRAVRCHLKIDTGMGRVGAHPHDGASLAAAIEAEPFLELAAVMSHFACADEADHSTTQRQLHLFGEVLAELERGGLRPPLAHIANTAGLLAHPSSQLNLVRAGIGVYGIAPSPELAGLVQLEPALRLVANVTWVKQVPAGERISYGHRWEATHDTTVATLAIGYADGVPRRLGLVGAPVLIGGRVAHVAGVVTMDQMMIDCGPDSDVRRGDEAVLLGTDGDHTIGPWDWAQLCDTIAYEIVTSLRGRLVRRYVTSGVDRGPHG